MAAGPRTQKQCEARNKCIEGLVIYRWTWWTIYSETGLPELSLIGSVGQALSECRAVATLSANAGRGYAEEARVLER